MSNGCVWTTNNLACVNAWAFLRGLGQLRPSFPNSGDITMESLAFWNDAASAEVRRSDAMELAAQLDRIYRKALMAKYESTFQASTAIGALADALVQRNVTICQFAEIVDSVYNFRGELG